MKSSTENRKLMAIQENQNVNIAVCTFEINWENNKRAKELLDNESYWLLLDFSRGTGENKQPKFSFLFAVHCTNDVPLLLDADEVNIPQGIYLPLWHCGKKLHESVDQQNMCYSNDLPALQPHSITLRLAKNERGNNALVSTPDSIQLVKNRVYELCISFEQSEPAYDAFVNNELIGLISVVQPDQNDPRLVRTLSEFKIILDLRWDEGIEPLLDNCAVKTSAARKRMENHTTTQTRKITVHAQKNARHRSRSFDGTHGPINAAPAVATAATAGPTTAATCAAAAAAPVTTTTHYATATATPAAAAAASCVVQVASTITTTAATDAGAGSAAVPAVTSNAVYVSSAAPNAYRVSVATSVVDSAPNAQTRTHTTTVNTSIASPPTVTTDDGAAVPIVNSFFTTTPTIVPNRKINNDRKADNERRRTWCAVL